LLFESRAICRYIIAKYAPESALIPTDTKSRALFEQAASIETSYFDSPATTIMMEKVVKRYLFFFSL
jgi:glutathione S-transferase